MAISLLRLLQGASILGAAGAAGANLSLSTFMIPRLLESPPDVMLRQWKKALFTGRNAFIPTAAVVALAHIGVFFASSASAASAASRLPLAAAASAVAIVPYTFAVIAPTNRALLAREEKVSADSSKTDAAVSAQETASSRALVDHWATLNLGRSLLLAVSAVLGLVAAL